MKEYDFSSIILLKEEKVLLNKFSSNHSIKLVHSDAFPLLRYGFIYQHSIGYDDVGEVITDDQYSLTDLGKRYKQFIKFSSRQRFLKEFRAWFTLLVAVAAFTKSFFF